MSVPTPDIISVGTEIISVGPDIISVGPHIISVGKVAIVGKVPIVCSVSSRVFSRL